MAKSKLRLKMREKTLLLNSHVIEEHMWLRDLLETNKRITEELVNSLLEEQQNFFNNILNRIIQQATEEWKGDKEHPADDLEGERIRCSLCGQPIRYVFYIYNQLNDKELVVGSECVKHFGINIGYHGMTIEQIQKRATRLKHLNKLNEIFPGIAQIVEGWHQKLNSYPIIIPISLEGPYVDIGESLKKPYEEYLSGKNDNYIVSRISSLLDKRKQKIIEIEDYVNKNKFNKFIPTREIAYWADRELLNRLKRDGKITWGTACKIYEPGFIKSIIPELNKKLGSLGIKILEFDQNLKGYILELSVRKKIKLLCKHNKFIFDYGYLIFGLVDDEPTENLSIGRIVEISDIFGDNSIYSFIEELSTLTKGSIIRFWGLDVDFNELVVFDRTLNQYVVVNLKELMQRFKKFTFGIDGNIKDVVLYITRLPNKRYTLKEFLDQHDRYNDRGKRLA